MKLRSTLSKEGVEMKKTDTESTTSLMILQPIMETSLMSAIGYMQFGKENGTMISSRTSTSY